MIRLEYKNIDFLLEIWYNIARGVKNEIKYWCNFWWEKFRT